MAEVAGYPDSIDKMASATSLTTSSPAIRMAPNPVFSFPPPPAVPRSTPHMQSPNFSASHRRGKSMNYDAIGARQPAAAASHKRGASAAMPSFSFNASDMSGRTVDEPEPALPTTPSRSTAHKRQDDTFVGGVGVADAINASPTKTGALPIPSRRHAHGRANSRVTLTGQDWSQIMTAAEMHQPRLSTSLPNTPLEHSRNELSNDGQYTFATPDRLPRTPPRESTNTLDRPPSRPRVEFSENVEYIPRPLSTISSGTESSMSTVRGHSVNNSISSVLSMNTPSPPSSRARATSLETTLEDEPRKAPRSSIELSSRRIEKEGQWLKSMPSGESLQRPTTEPVTRSSRLTFSTVEASDKTHASHKKRQSIGHALGLDRRRSEPAFGNCNDEPSHCSALSLQEPSTDTTGLDDDRNVGSDKRSSSQKLKDWAKAKVLRKAPPKSVYLAMPRPAQAGDASPVSEPAVAETDLDAVFSLDPDVLAAGTVRARPVTSVDPSVRHTWSSPRFADNEDFGTLLDLDAAVRPSKSPNVGMLKQSKAYHSGRRLLDFDGPGGHYQRNPNHRRTESAPMLTPFDYTPPFATPQPFMADVFEEDEEEEHSALANTAINRSISADDEAGTGVEIVELDTESDRSASRMGSNEGLRIRDGLWEPERPSTSYSNMSSRLSMPVFDRRASVIEDTIEEEASPGEPAIVEAHEEPRAQSLTKSSDSSETPTILAAQTGLLTLPDGQLLTPETYNSSVFSSPDIGRRQGSFETSRLGTSASSVTDNRTMSSCTTGEAMNDLRVSVDDVPSLTSSRSTMISTSHAPANSSSRDVSGMRASSVASSGLDAAAFEQRRKRGSIQSLSQLMSGSFGPRNARGEVARPQTATDALHTKTPKKKEHNRLKKLMFWKSKHRQGSSSTIL